MTKRFPDVDPANAEPLVRGGQGRTAYEIVDAAMITGLSVFVIASLTWFCWMFWRSIP